jgi:hypothetical protein
MSGARRAGLWLAAGIGVAAGVYGVVAGTTWWRYGDPPAADADELDPLLDRFMPAYEIAERHHIRVEAPAEITLATAREMDLFQSPVARAIFRARELLLGAEPDAAPRLAGLLAQVQSMGWVVLAEVPGREVVVGAVTKPWQANVTFRGVPADEFTAFGEPDYVKIVWTLRADALGPDVSVFRTETRAVATDAAARAKFRRYWSMVSPGIVLIRLSMLRPVAREAGRRARALTEPHHGA